MAARSCHVPPLVTELGNKLRGPSEIGVDSFLAGRSPTRTCRTAPLAGLWSDKRATFRNTEISLCFSVLSSS